MRGSAPAHPRHRAQPAGPRGRHAGVDRLQVAVPRSQSRRHHLPGRAAPRAACRAGLRVGRRRRALRDGRDRRRHQELHQGVVAALHPAAGMGAQQPGRRRRRADRAAAGGRAESDAAGQTGIARRGPNSKSEWRADARGLELDRAAHLEARARAPRARRALLLDRARAGAHGRAHRQGRVHPRGPGRAGRRAAARSTRPAIRARSSSRSSTRSRCASARRATRITAKATSGSPWTR